MPTGISGAVAVLMLAVGAAQISWQFVLWCWAQQGIFIAAHSAKAEVASIELTSKTSSTVMVGLIIFPALI